MKATFRKYTLNFKRPSGTSRGILTEKDSWFLILEDQGKIGIGECGLLKGLSCDDVQGYEDQLQWVCGELEGGRIQLLPQLGRYPSIAFGLEQALRSLSARHPFELFPSDFTRGEDRIPINGLIWMGDREFMLRQVHEKLEQGFRCIKLKIGALDFESELDILQTIRKEYSADTIELRVDANGAFSAPQALEKLKRLSEMELHSIEQPIRPGQWETMRDLCMHTPLPIALDEELIGIGDVSRKEALLQTIGPQYLILKPSLLGGYAACDEWIRLAEKTGAGWWATSALESNIGLNAIAQWTYLKAGGMPQGLGTGSLFTNNFNSPLSVGGGYLSYDSNMHWNEQILSELCI